MLRELSVQNMALIEDVRVELQPGFCAWSGETGAGKTLLLEALGLLLGERGNVELLRTGAEELRVAGRFELQKPEVRKQVEDLLQRPLDEDDVAILRRLTAAGRGYAYLNDQPVTLATLQQIGPLLVDIHGQRESLSLLEPTYQLQLLDAFGNLDKPAQQYFEQAEEIRELRKRLAQLEADRQQRIRELNMVRFEREELDQAELVAGELAALSQERERLVHAQALQNFADSTCARLYDDEGAFFEVLGKLEREGEHWSKVDPSLHDIAVRLKGLSSETQDLVQTLRPLAQRYQADPERREEVDERLQKLKRLEAKYGKSIDDLIGYRGTLDIREKELASQEEDRGQIENELGKRFSELRATAKKLSQQRHKVAKKFAAEVLKELSDLGMSEAQLDVALTPIEVGDDPLQAEIPQDGFDRVELMLAANRGEPARPLRKVASGGEMSRTMLALKTVLAGQDQVGTLVFDEIDANVGGRLGDIVGTKLARLGRSHQVICVTHLPQVASYARHQWTIRKDRQAKRTVTKITYLEEKERLEELASMLRGSSRGETTLKEAAAMLTAAKKKW